MTNHQAEGRTALSASFREAARHALAAKKIQKAHDYIQVAENLEAAENGTEARVRAFTDLPEDGEEGIMTPEEERAFTERVLAEVRKAMDDWAVEFTRAFLLAQRDPNAV